MLRLRQHRQLHEFRLRERRVEQTEREGIDHVFGVVQHDHPKAHPAAPLIRLQGCVETIEAVGLGRRPITVVQYEPHARIAARTGDDGCGGGAVVAVEAGVDP